MFSNLRDAVTCVRDVVSALEPASLRPEEAEAAVDLFAELERLASAGRTLAGRRVERSSLWHARGYRTPALWMAAQARTTLGAAITTMDTGRGLERFSATAQAFRKGTLSATQAAEICAAAAANPAAEGSLLDSAMTESVNGLRERCREVREAAGGDRDADEWLHRSRYLRHWRGPDGAVRLDARLTPDAGARLVAAIAARCRTLRNAARAVGAPERQEAHAADALVSLADGSTPGPRAVVHVHVDHGAWTRGYAENGESCGIPGIGPVSVAAARRLAADGVVKAVLADEADVRGIAHLGRSIPARVRTALEARDQTCVVPGCDASEGLEIDHVVPLAAGGSTRLDNLARLCHWHHALKTHRGWRLEGRPGSWRWIKPRPRACGPPPSPG